MFSNIIARTPCRNMVEGITTAGLGKPDYELALQQHQHYLEALTRCGVSVTLLDAIEDYPDSCFVEDVALMTPHCAIITNPGASSRKGEVDHIKEAIGQFRDNIETIESPGTVEAGDIMMVGTHFYIGLSERTNEQGARQMIDHLEKYGLSGSIVQLSECLHLKTGITYIENNVMLATGEFITKPEFADYDIITIDVDEAYAANCIWVNGTVIVPQGFPKTLRAIQARGYKTLTVDVSEFQKIDGGLSCLSLRF